MREHTPCFLCLAPADNTCKHCNQVAFCNENHLAMHRVEGRCLPYMVEEREGKGKCIIATRDINQKEMILFDRPILVSPNTKSKAQCLQCSKLCDGGYKCPVCNFPMCDETCASGDVHQLECEVFARVDFEADVEDPKVPDDHYAAILPLRCIRLKEKDPEKWKLFQSFQSHCSERKQDNQKLWDYHEEHAVEFVRELCEYGEEVTGEEIHRMIGIMSVNSLSIELGEGYGEEMGFYPAFSNINHSCLANAKPVKRNDKSVTVMAKTEIKKGEEITFQYVVEIQPTRLRRELLNRKWFFLCSCNRCCDRTECGTFLGALLCRDNNCGGPVVPDSPTKASTDFSCLECNHVVKGEDAIKIMNEAEINTRKKDVSDHVVAHLEKFLAKYASFLHPYNYVMASMKMKLGCLYGNCPDYSLTNMNKAMMTRKLQVCQESLVPLAILDEGQVGENKWKGRLEKEISKTQYLLENM